MKVGILINAIYNLLLLGIILFGFFFILKGAYLSLFKKNIKGNGYTKKGLMGVILSAAVYILFKLIWIYS